MRRVRPDLATICLLFDHERWRSFAVVAQPGEGAKVALGGPGIALALKRLLAMRTFTVRKESPLVHFG